MIHANKLYQGALSHLQHEVREMVSTSRDYNSDPYTRDGMGIIPRREQKLIPVLAKLTLVPSAEFGL